MSQILKAYFFCTFLGYNLYFFSRFFVLFLGDKPVATLTMGQSSGFQETRTIRKNQNNQSLLNLDTEYWIVKRDRLTGF